MTSLDSLGAGSTKVWSKEMVRFHQAYHLKHRKVNN